MDIMLDLETLATSPDSVILTFGAIKFNPFDPDQELDDGLYFRINVDNKSHLDVMLTKAQWLGGELKVKK